MRVQRRIARSRVACRSAGHDGVSATRVQRRVASSSVASAPVDHGSRPATRVQRRIARARVHYSRTRQRVRLGAALMGASMLAIGVRMTAVAGDLPDAQAQSDTRDALRLEPNEWTDVKPVPADAPTTDDDLANANIDTGGSADEVTFGERMALGETMSGSGSAEEAAMFTRRFYAGLGGGLSRLEPESRTTGLSVGDEDSAGFHLFAGYDFSRWLSGEVYVADLGDAQIDFLDTDVGDMGYQVYGVSMLAYLLNSQSGTSLGNREDGLFRREGASLYARAGVGGMRNDSELDYDRDHTAHLALGAGVEYGFANGVAVRAELMAFDTDARYGTVSVLKRFGSVAAPAVPVVAQRSTPVVEPKRAPAPPPPPPPPPMPAALAETEYTYFGFDETRLGPGTMARLDDLVDDLMGDDAELDVAGHTDSTGDEQYNMDLSQRRATVVESYLVSRGVDANRLNVTAYGETMPVADNATEEGRANNRRVEISRR